MSKKKQKAANAAKNAEVRVCPVCGKKFTPKASNQVYCGPKCKAVAKRAAEKRHNAASAKGAKAGAVKAKVDVRKITCPIEMFGVGLSIIADALKAVSANYRAHGIGKAKAKK